ncbi:hypothetical protein [Xanthomonas virus PB119]|nr:hypothetical protein [Xanthomonas virus PB119]
MDGELKKITLRLDSAEGESKTLILIGSRHTTGNLSRLLFDQTITIRANETLTVVKEEDMPNPGIVGHRGTQILIDDISEMEKRVIQHIACREAHEVMLVEPQLKCWQQHRPYGKKARRGK